MPTLHRLTQFATAAVVALAVACGVEARADVVYGNLGNTGSGGLSTSLTDFGPNASPPITQSLAQGFTTGSSVNFLKLTSIDLGLFATGTNPTSVTVEIRADDGGKPGASLYSSSPTNVQSTSKYTFSFPAVTLSALTTYWAVPVPNPASPEVVSWYQASSPSLIGRNGSGYGYASTMRYGQFDPPEVTTVDWYAAPSTNYSISVTAVPEPAWLTTVIGALGVGVAFRAFRGRKVRG